MQRNSRANWVLAALVAVGATASSAAAQSTDVAAAMKYVPRQKGVEYDTPTAEELPKCEMKVTEDGQGWVVNDPNGRTLRMFLDTNGSGTVDNWRYYRNGLEVYRDIDTNNDRSADQFRWFHSGGSRWGLDTNEDGVIDQWKSISAEEASAEVVAAIANNDVRRFMRVALTAEELQSLGLGQELTDKITAELQDLPAKFQQLTSSQTIVTPETEWVQFSGNRPGLAPAGRDGSTQDVRYYGNVIAFIQNNGENEQVSIGNMVRIGDNWRVVGLPGVGQDMVKADIIGGGNNDKAPVVVDNFDQPTEEAKKIMDQLEQLDQSLAQTADPAARAKLHTQRAQAVLDLAKMAKTTDERNMWLRQLADTASAAAQVGEFPQGVKLLEQLAESLGESDATIAAYIDYRRMAADYGAKMAGGDPDYMKDGEPDYVRIQGEWVENLETLVERYPTSAEAAEAMLQLANNHEFAQQDKEALAWYKRITDEFADLPIARQAAGAQRRLQSEGQAIPFKGKTADGKLVDLAAYRGRVVVIQYWASWCEPCKADMAVLKELVSRYGKDGFSVIGVNLDTQAAEMQTFLTRFQLPWNNIHEGGLDSEPAVQLGIVNVPTMLLVDKTGKVVNNDIRTADLDREVSSLMR